MDVLLDDIFLSGIDLYQSSPMANLVTIRTSYQFEISLRRLSSKFCQADDKNGSILRWGFFQLKRASFCKQQMKFTCSPSDAPLYGDGGVIYTPSIDRNLLRVGRSSALHSSEQSNFWKGIQGYPFLFLECAEGSGIKNVRELVSSENQSCFGI